MNFFLMKTVLIDFTRLAEKCGFGEIADNYSERIIRVQEAENLHFVFLVKQEHVGCLGNSVDYVSVENLKHDLKRLNKKIDLWHTTDQLFIKRKHCRDMKNLLTIHDLNFLHEKKGIHKLKTLWKLKWHIWRSDCITVISEYVKTDLLNHVNIGQKPLYLIYNGIKDTDYEQQERPRFVDSDKKILFTIGQTRAKKNFQSLIPMMKFLPDYKLYVCGKPYGKYIHHLEALKEEWGTENVVFTGEISNKEKNWMYAHCDAFLFPSFLEGFGLPVLEAMRFNTKVFASRFTSLPEVCKNHATYFDSYEPELMAKVVEKGIASWSRDSQEAQEAQEYSKGFTYEKYTQAYISLYKKILDV